MAGRTVAHQMNTPTKYAVIHGNGGGLFGSYNRSIPKTNQGQGNRIKIKDNSYKNENEGYSKVKDKKSKLNITHEPTGKKEIVDFRVRSSSNSKKYRYNNEVVNNSPGNRGCTGKKKKKNYKGNYGEHHTVEKKESILQSALDRNMKVI